MLNPFSRPYPAHGALSNGILFSRIRVVAGWESPNFSKSKNPSPGFFPHFSAFQPIPSLETQLTNLPLFDLILHQKKVFAYT